MMENYSKNKNKKGQIENVYKINKSRFFYRNYTYKWGKKSKHIQRNFTFN